MLGFLLPSLFFIALITSLACLNIQKNKNMMIMNIDIAWSLGLFWHIYDFIIMWQADNQARASRSSSGQVPWSIQRKQHYQGLKLWSRSQLRHCHNPWYCKKLQQLMWLQLWLWHSRKLQKPWCCRCNYSQGLFFKTLNII